MISSRIKLLREELMMTQKEFGEAIGVSRGYVSTLEKPGYVPSERILKLLCYRFSVSIDWLQHGTGPMYEYGVQPLGIRLERLSEIESSIPGEFVEGAQYMCLFRCQELADILEHILHRVCSPEADNYESQRIAALYRVVFPDFRKV